MLKIHPRIMQDLQNATTGKDLLPLVQGAIQLEHATIPLYLCGLFTLKPGANIEVGNIIRSVVIEEMLHMTLASNLMLALDGSPAINCPQFVPDYPGGLPFDIGDNLQIHLRKCSIDQIKEVYMAIEEPEDPIDIPTEAMMAGAALEPEFETIGVFYTYLSQKIGSLGEGIFKGNPDHQVVATQWFPVSEEMFPITNVASAQKAINVIVNQGEGARTSPFDDFGSPAHYYRFKQIVEGRELVKRPGEKPPYAFGGDPVMLDPANVWNMDPDPKIAKYKVGSRSHRMAVQFSYSYTMLLNALHETFNGNPTMLDHAMGVMYELRLLSQQVLATPAEFAHANNSDQLMTGLSFEYQTVNT